MMPENKYVSNSNLIKLKKSEIKLNNKHKRKKSQLNLCLENMVTLKVTLAIL